MSDIKSGPAEPSANGESAGGDAVPAEESATGKVAGVERPSRPIVFWFIILGLPLIAAVAGVCLLGWAVRDRGLDGLLGFVAVDWRVTCGYFLFLLTCAVVFMVIMRSFSESSQKLSIAIVGAVGIAFLTDCAENILVLISPSRSGFLNWVPDSSMSRLPIRFWTFAPEALATVKWCTLVVAVFAIPAAGFAVWRVVASHFARRARRQNDQDWWDRALDVPGPDPADASQDAQNDIESAWRQAYYVPEARKLLTGPRRPTALCLSGGGIRSGCVAMGAMQTLAREAEGDEQRWPEAPLLDEFDYIISVSGGGYTAGARLLAVQGEDGGAETPLAARFNPGSPEFAFLRRRASYIADSPLGLVRALGEVLKNLVASLLMVFLVAVIAGWIFGWFVARVPLAAFVPWREGDVASDLPALDNHYGVAAVAVAIPVAFALIFGACALICEYISISPRSTQAKSGFSLAATGAGVLAFLTFAVTWALPGLVWLCAPLVPTAEDKAPPAAAFGGLAAVLVLQYGATLISMLTKKKDSSTAGQVSKLRKMLPPGVVQLGIVLLSLIVLAAAWLLVLGITSAQVFTWVTHDFSKLTAVPYWQPILLGIAVVVIALNCVDVTSLSLHPFYRRRLARALDVRRIKGEAVGYDPLEGTMLDQYGCAQDGGPKFVFAAAAALTGDAKPAPGLDAVSYVMSADYIGGPSLGWLNTANLIEVAPPRIKRDLTVQAAVAISGAAFASAMGRQNKGFQSLLAVSGARLGTWLPNPTFVKYAQENAANGLYPKALPSVRGAGYFYRELLGINRHDARLVQVTDGGHYENLGLVEALRRRCRLIYVIDGGGDTPPLLSGLSDAIRLARYELGVEIELDEGDEFGVPMLAPGSATPYGRGHAFYSLNSRVTAGAVLRGRIKYPPAANLGPDDEGLLIVAKAVLWNDLPDWVLTYGAGKGGDDFPHDKTSDQWFNEAQFACYTEIGRRIAVKARTVEPHPILPDEPPDVELVGGDGQS